MSQQTLILNRQEIAQKTKRIAYQILENNYTEKELYFLGIKNRGFKYATQLAEMMKQISKIDASLHSIKINKRNPLAAEVESSIEQESLNDKVIILVDDVANTGRTLFYAMKPLFSYLPKKIQVAVLVDRRHKSFPISVDYVGLSLSTTMQEHISVDFSSKQLAAYLS